MDPRGLGKPSRYRCTVHSRSYIFECKVESIICQKKNWYCEHTIPRTLRVETVHMFFSEFFPLSPFTFTSLITPQGGSTSATSDLLWLASLPSSRLTLKRPPPEGLARVISKSSEVMPSAAAWLVPWKSQHSSTKVEMVYCSCLHLFVIRSVCFHIVLWAALTCLSISCLNNDVEISITDIYSIFLYACVCDDLSCARSSCLTLDLPPFPKPLGAHPWNKMIFSK